MSTSSTYGRKSPLGPIVVSIVVILAVAGYAAYSTWSAHQKSTNRGAVASGYEHQALSSPFKLQSRTWQPTSGTWLYQYAADTTGPSALAAADDQTSIGGYQVIATQPDVVSGSHATLYRDLITGNVSIVVQMAPSLGATFSKGPIAADVTVSPLGSN